MDKNEVVHIPKVSRFAQQRFTANSRLVPGNLFFNATFISSLFFLRKSR